MNKNKLLVVILLMYLNGNILPTYAENNAFWRMQQDAQNREIIKQQKEIKNQLDWTNFQQLTNRLQQQPKTSGNELDPVIQIKAKQLADKRNKEMWDLGWDFYKNQKPIPKGNYKNGQLDGKVKFYTENGKLISEATFNSGILQGVAKIYYPEGQLHKVFNYVNGEDEGTSKYYYRSGELGLVINYKNGKKNGEEILYYKTGELASTSQFINGMPVGLFKTYFPNGRVQYIHDYSQGWKNYTIKEYDYNGNLRFVDTYINDEKVNRKAFNEQGKLTFSQDY